MSTVSVQVRLAQAVSSQPHAYVLSPGNTLEAVIPLADAVRRGLAFFVVPRPELLVVDADMPTDPRQAAGRLESFQVLLAAAERVGVPHVVVASGRPGNRHAYLLTGSGPGRDVVEEWLRGRGLDVRGRGIRPPGARHRDGLHTAVPVQPDDPDRVLDVLHSPVRPAVCAALARELVVPMSLPPRVYSALRYGHAAAGYESPSHARMALAVAVHARHGSPSLLSSLLDDVTSPLGATYRARPARWRAQERVRLWDKAGRWLDTRPDVDPGPARAAAWLSAARAHPWSGMAGGTDVALCEALGQVAARAGTVRVALALRDAAIGAGVSPDTARASLRRLMAAGWVQLAAEATARTARVYALTIPPAAAVGVAGRGASGVETGREGSPFADLGSDLARWQALGKLTSRVGQAVVGGASSVPALSAELGMAACSVRHHLRKLAGHGLAVREAGGRWTVKADPGIVGQVAAGLGVAGRRERERALLAARRAERAAARASYRGGGDGLALVVSAALPSLAAAGR